MVERPGGGAAGRQPTTGLQCAAGGAAHVAGSTISSGAIKLGAQLPILVRGIYYEGWHVAATPTWERHVEDFAEHVLSELPREIPVDALTVARGVLEILREKLDPGEFEKVLNHLPASLRAMKA